MLILVSLSSLRWWQNRGTFSVGLWRRWWWDFWGDSFLKWWERETSRLRTWTCALRSWRWKEGWWSPIGRIFRWSCFCKSWRLPMIRRWSRRLESAVAGEMLFAWALLASPSHGICFAFSILCFWLFKERNKYIDITYWHMTFENSIFLVLVLLVENNSLGSSNLQNYQVFGKILRYPPCYAIICSCVIPFDGVVALWNTI